MHYRLSALLVGLLVALGGSAGAQQQTGPYIQVSPTPSKLSVGGPGFVQVDANGIASVVAQAPGSGTVTNTAGALTANSMVVGNGSADIKTIAGSIGGAFTTSGPFTTTGAASGVTFALPANGPFTFTFPPASQTLSSLAGAETFTNKIYNGGQLSGTFSGNPTFSGIPLFTNLLPGTQVACLGLDSSFHLVTLAASCGAGGGTTFANPTATASDVAVNGSATTAMRSDAAPAVQKATNAVFGLAKGDGTTLTCVAGVCSSLTGGAGTVTQNGNLTTNSVLIGGTNGTTDAKADTKLSETGSSFIANYNATSLPASVTGGSQLQIGAPDGSSARILMDSFGTATGASFAMRTSRGTNASPTALQSGDIIGAITGFGYGATGYSSAHRSRFVESAAENWTDTAQGTKLLFGVTPNTTLTTANKVSIENDGGVTAAADVVGAGPTGGSKGAGTVNVSGGYYANGVKLAVPTTNGQLVIGSTGADSVAALPTAGTSNVTITGSAGGLAIGTNVPIQDRSGAGTAIVTGDNTKIVLLGAFTYTLAQAGGAGFTTGWGACLLNVGATNATVNATTSVFKGAGGSTSLVLAPSAWACPASNGADYITTSGGNLVAGSNVTLTRNADGTITIASTGGGSSAPAIPQGRLTLSTGKPVQTADVTAATTVYYDTYQGNQVPVWNGSAMVGLTITADEISFGLSATNHPASGFFDIFAVNNSGSIALCTVAWTNGTTRASAISLKNGVQTITAAPTHCWGGAAGATDLVAAIGGANQATLVGCMATTGTNGQTAMQFHPTPASGGPSGGAWRGVSNAYNMKRGASTALDSKASWTIAGTSFAAIDASNNIRVSYMDCLGEYDVSAHLLVNNVAANTGYDVYGICRDSTSCTPEQQAMVGNVGTTAQIAWTGTFTFVPSLGFHYLQGVEEYITAAGTDYGDRNAGLNIEISY